MARKLRIQYEGAIYHVKILWGQGLSIIFLALVSLSTGSLNDAPTLRSFG